MPFLDATHPVRLFFVWLATHPVFEHFILLTILANTAVLAMTDYHARTASGDVDLTGSWNASLDTAETVFTAIFTVEMVLKMVAMGVVMDEGSYLRDGWNVLDFIVVITALLGLLPGVPSLSPMRVVRLLRPLRTLNAIPGMRILVQSLLRSIPPLINVVVLLFFILLIFGILGLQLWSGILWRRCRLTEYPVRIDPALFNNSLGPDSACQLPGSPECLRLFVLPGSEFYASYVSGVDPLEAVTFLNASTTTPTSLARTIDAALSPPLSTPYASHFVPHLGMHVSTLLNASVLAPCIVDPATHRPLTHDEPLLWNQATSPWARRRDCFWPYDIDLPRVCSASDAGFYLCPNGRWCGSEYDPFGNPRFSAKLAMLQPQYIEQRNFGLTNFDNFGAALLTIFQCITLEGWTPILAMFADAFNSFGAGLYFVALIVLGSFFFLNLTLAVIWDTFSAGQDEIAKAEKEKLEAESRRRRKEDAQAIEREEAARDARAAILAAFGPPKKGGGGGGGGGDLTMAALNTSNNSISSPPVVSGPKPPPPPVAVSWSNTMRPYPTSYIERELTVLRLPAWRVPGYRIVRNPWFFPFVVLLIVLNTVVLAADRYPSSEAEGDVWDAVNVALTCAFAVELLCKLWAYSLREYLSDTMNVFDFLVVVATVADLFANPPPVLLVGSSAQPDQGNSSGAVSALRAFRLLRVFALARHWRSLQVLLETVAITLVDISYFALLLILVIFIFALLGEQFFAMRYCFDPATGLAVDVMLQTGSCPPPYVAPRLNFNDVGTAALTIFEILTEENWNTVLYDGIRARGPAAALYFIIVMVVANWIMLSLFLAILLGNFEAMEELAGDETEEEGGLTLDEKRRDDYFRALKEQGRLPPGLELPAPPLDGAQLLGPVGPKEGHKPPPGAPQPLLQFHTLAPENLVGTDDEETTGPNVALRTVQTAVNVLVAAALDSNISILPAAERTEDNTSTERRRAKRSATAHPRVLSTQEDSTKDDSATPTTPATTSTATRAHTWAVPRSHRAKVAPARETELAPLASLHVVRVNAAHNATPTPLPPSGAATAPLSSSTEDAEARTVDPSRSSGATAHGATGGAAGYNIVNTNNSDDSHTHTLHRDDPPATILIEPVPPTHRMPSHGRPRLPPIRLEPVKSESSVGADEAAARSSRGGGGGGGAADSQRSNPSGSKPGSANPILGAIGMRDTEPHSAPAQRRTGSDGIDEFVEDDESDQDQEQEEHGDEGERTRSGRRKEPSSRKALLEEKERTEDPADSQASVNDSSSSDDNLTNEATIITDSSTISAGSVEKKLGIKRRLSFHGKSLCCLPPRHPWRRWLGRIVQHPRFDQVVIVVILLSTICLAIDNPLRAPDSPLIAPLFTLDVIFAIFFTIEALVKIVIFGFLFHRNAYLRSAWNVLDFLVVIVSIISIVSASSPSPSTSSPALRALRSLRALRALRPLRVISRLETMQVVVNSLISSLSAIVNVCLLCLLFFLVFGIVGVSYFKGSFYACDGKLFELDAADPAVSTDVRITLVIDPLPFSALTPDHLFFLSPPSQHLYSSHYATRAPTSHVVCDMYGDSGRHWLREFDALGEAFLANSSSTISAFSTLANLTATLSTLAVRAETSDYHWRPTIPSNFDNIFRGMMTLFEMSTTEGWLDVMYAGIDSVGIDMQPRPNHQPGWTIFFVAFMFIGSFFVANLFVGVVIEHFNRMRDRLGDGLLLTDEQREWQHTYKRMMRFRPKLPSPPSPYLLVRQCRALVQHPWFELAIMACIVLNTIAMGIVYFGMPNLYAVVLADLNYAFAGVFTLEVVLKLVGLGAWDYFSSRWNIFDFLIVLLTDVGILVELVFHISFGPIATVVRTVRVGRAIRLAKRAVMLQRLFDTFILTIPKFLNIGLVLVLLLLIYAILGVQLFAAVAWTDNVNSQSNFQTLGGAMLLTLRFSTGEAWNAVMHDVASSPPGCVADYNLVPWAERQHICGFGEHPSYNPPDCVPPRGCGSAAAYPYFLSFTLLITFIFLNLFIAVILERFDLSAEESGEGDEASGLDAKHLTDSQFEHLQEKWLLFDPEAKLEISADVLIDLLRILRPPLGFADEADAPEARLLLRAAHLNVPMRAGRKVHFADVAEALARRVFEDRARKDGRVFRVPENQALRRRWQQTFGTENMNREPFDIDNYYAAKIIERMFHATLLRRRAQKLSSTVAKVVEAAAVHSKRSLPSIHPPKPKRPQVDPDFANTVAAAPPRARYLVRRFSVLVRHRVRRALAHAGGEGEDLGAGVVG